MIFVRSQPSLAASCYRPICSRARGTSSDRTAICSRRPPSGDVRPLKVPRIRLPAIRVRAADRVDYDALFGKPTRVRVRVRAVSQPPADSSTISAATLGMRQPVRLEQRSAEPLLAKGDPAARESDEPFHPPFGQRQARHRAHSLIGTGEGRSYSNDSIACKFWRAAVGRGVATRRQTVPVDRRSESATATLALERRMGVDLHALGYFGDPSAEVDRPQRAPLLQHLKN